MRIWYLIRLSILITYLLDNVTILWGDVSCWSLLRVQGLMRVCSQGNSPLHFVAIPFLPLSADCGGGGGGWLVHKVGRRVGGIWVSASVYRYHISLVLTLNFPLLYEHWPHRQKKNYQFRRERVDVSIVTPPSLSVLVTASIGVFVDCNSNKIHSTTL